ncbi:MAG: hypothetical protein RL129_49 [Actinomycetota bacterium]|jgi:hypothetical protein
MKHSEFLFGAKIQQLVSKYGATTFSTNRKSPLINRFFENSLGKSTFGLPAKAESASKTKRKNCESDSSAQRKVNRWKLIRQT